MTSRFHTRQAGEGKVGCFVTLTILIVGIAAAIKAGPVYYSNNEFINTIKDNIAPMASRATDEEVMSQIRAKAKELDIPEALRPEAIHVTVTSPPDSMSPGNINIRLRYERRVDFYGVYAYTFVTDESIDRVVFNGR